MELSSMNRQLLSLALAAASLSAAPLAFAQDAHASDSAREHASTQAMEQHMGTQDAAQTTPATPATPADPQQETPATPATPADPAGPKKVSWSELDGDHDGKLSKAEAAPVDALAQAFDTADADKDGALTADEYKAYLAARQDSPSPSTPAR
jgi:hypothetical protein